MPTTHRRTTTGHPHHTPTAAQARRTVRRTGFATAALGLMLLAPVAGPALPAHADDEPRILQEAPSDAILPRWQPEDPNQELILRVETPILPRQADDRAWTKQEADGGEQTILSGDVNFDKNEATLTPRAQEILDEMAESWADSPPGTVTIVGHTDTDGDEAENQDLSERRAQSVADHLEEKVPGLTIEVSGKGESEPRFDETKGSPEEQKEAKFGNRRVVITAKD